ncbi:DeoR/GlpR family DNA-binding transcription regulator [Umezawaea sp.]|uniref:DeoR/GlpR family DNA-binding transcription regulator n=1 Tax=Umezawaea sp. TaxID=1955258 RepID=UPI002ECFD5E3
MQVFAPERQARILSELRRNGRVEVAALAVLFEVSEDTVRRDLRALSAAGHLHKTHGGAVLLDTARMDWTARADVAAATKRAIGETAATVVRPGDVLLLDAGSTVLAFARALAVRPLTVVTNSLDVALVFDADPEVDLALTGGRWDRGSRGLTGSAAVLSTARYRADWAFLGACALHPSVGATAVDPADADVKIAMADAALRTAVLADVTKHGHVEPHLVLPPDRISLIVTDAAEVSAPWLERHVEVLTPPAERDR